MINDDGPWNFDPPIASLRWGSLSAQVDISCPQRGIHDLRLDGSPITGELLSANWIADAAASDYYPAGWPMQVADAYVRGDDLVATYQRLPNWPFAPQIYWRAEPAERSENQLDSLSLLVSVQTDSLDTHPRIRVTTRLAADEVIRVEQAAGSKMHGAGSSASSSSPLPAACLLWRLSGGDLSYAEIVPAGQFQQLSFEHDEDGNAIAHWDLFAEFLEKGVIRRACIQSVFLPRERDLELAAVCCRAVERRPLPLTT